MTKLRLFTVIALCVASAILLFTMVAFMNIEKNKSSGFKRNKISLQLEKTYTTKIRYSIYKIAGNHNDTIILYTPNPFEYLKTNFQLNFTEYFNIDLNLGQDSVRLKRLFRSILDYPNIEVLGGNLKSVFRYNLNNGEKSKTSFTRNFTRGLKISKNAYVLRQFDSTMKDQIFVKENSADNTIVYENDISPKLNDAGISTDGLFRFDSTNNQIIYIHHYGNDFICMDTNLGLKKRVKTIDTFSTYSVEVTSRQTNTQKTIFNFSKPRYVINANARIFNGYLFMQSMLKADNEKPREFDNNSIFDVYSCKTGAYAGSIYLPKHNGERLSDFHFIDSNEIIAVYRSAIIRYKINFYINDNRFNELVSMSK